MAISLPPPLPPVPPPITPTNQLQSRKKHELIKNSNNGDNNSNSEQDDEFSLEVRFYPCVLLNYSNKFYLNKYYFKPTNRKKTNNKNIADNENEILSHSDLRSYIISGCHSNTALNFTAPPNPPPPVAARHIPPLISIPSHQQPSLS
jgi:hypothetical protein